MQILTNSLVFFTHREDQYHHLIDVLGEDSPFNPKGWHLLYKQYYGTHSCSFVTSYYAGNSLFLTVFCCPVPIFLSQTRSWITSSSAASSGWFIIIPVCCGRRRRCSARWWRPPWGCSTGSEKWSNSDSSAPILASNCCNHVERIRTLLLPGLLKKESFKTNCRKIKSDKENHQTTR